MRSHVTRSTARTQYRTSSIEKRVTSINTLTPFTGEIIAFLTVLCWTVGSQFFEVAGKRVGALTVNLVRLVLAAVFLCLTLLVTRGQLVPWDFPLENWGWLALSGVIGFALGERIVAGSGSGSLLVIGEVVAPGFGFGKTVDQFLGLQARPVVAGHEHQVGRLVAGDADDLATVMDEQPGGQDAKVTVLMSDLRGFTHLAEGVAPEDALNMLNTYLGDMLRIISEHDGTIDNNGFIKNNGGTINNRAFIINHIAGTIQNDGDIFMMSFRTRRVTIFAGASPLSMKVALEALRSRRPASCVRQLPSVRWMRAPGSAALRTALSLLHSRTRSGLSATGTTRSRRQPTTR